MDLPDLAYKISFNVFLICWRYIWPQIIMSLKTSEQHFKLPYSLQISIQVWVCVREISGVEKFWRKFPQQWWDVCYSPSPPLIIHTLLLIQPVTIVWPFLCISLCLAWKTPWTPPLFRDIFCKFLPKSMTKFSSL